MKNTYAVLTQGMKDAIRINADSFHFTADSKSVLFISDKVTVAGFPTDKLIGVVADTAFAMKGLTKTPQ